MKNNILFIIFGFIMFLGFRNVNSSDLKTQQDQKLVKVVQGECKDIVIDNELYEDCVGGGIYPKESKI